MIEELEQLKQNVQTLKKKPDKKTVLNPGIFGYNATITILTDLFGCIFIGFAIGFFLQHIFHTNVLLTAGLTLLGGISGLYTTVRYALRLERQKKQEKSTR